MNPKNQSYESNRIEQIRKKEKEKYIVSKYSCLILYRKKN